MYRDFRYLYWWSGMKKEIAEYFLSCMICQQIKAEHQVPSGKLYPLEILEWKWDKITMDFVLGLPLNPSKKNSIWEMLVELYTFEIVRLHGIPTSIVSDRDLRFTSRFWKHLQESLGTKLLFNTDFHPQSNGKSERVIQVLKDLLRSFFRNVFTINILLNVVLSNIFPSELKPRFHTSRFHGSEDVEGEDDDSFNVWNLRKCSAAALDVLSNAKLAATGDEAWKDREAAVLALGVVGEGCINGLYPHLSEVTCVEEEAVLSQEAYILLYAKQGIPWFSTAIEVQKPCADPGISDSSPKS
ncbi:uncharacterized protein [Gossypium hirsutum]|uniref:Integrase catalytic domain-containing protein n=1 Tax=Gossypium hirsutum TaxID=3635 RepID=A0ABM3A1A2_GOSHI|nr:uncharacterized protein LOC121217184 [Gossypium hirsutum]